MTGTHQIRRRGRWLVVLIRGLATGVLIAGFIAGVPVVLLAVGSDPRHFLLPRPDQIRTALTERDDGTLLVTAAAAVAWCLWMYCTLWLLGETIAVVVRGTVPVVRGVAAFRRPISYLIAWITASVTVQSTGGPAAHAAVLSVPNPTPPPEHPGAGTPPASSAHVTVRVAPAGAAGLADISSWSSPQTGMPAHLGHRPVTVIVGRYDSLWRIAETHLGDGRRWVEIYRLNLDRPQPDGARLSDPNVLIEGWRLVLPTTGATATPPLGHDHAEIVVVRPGDTLSSIAGRHLGSAADARAVFEANVGRRQPDGGQLTDPDLIRPGWRLRIPTAQRPSTPSTGHPSPPSGRPGPATPRQPAPHPTDPPPRPTPSAPAQAAEPAPQDTAPPSAPGGERADRDPGGWVRLPSGSILGLGLVTILAGLAELVRRRRRQHRPTADPTDPDPPESSLPDVIQAAENAWLDVRRRTAHAHDDGHTLEQTLQAGQDSADLDYNADAEGGYFRDSGPDLDDSGAVPTSDPTPGTAAPDRERVENARSISPGVFPAPSLLALTGAPAAAKLAEHIWNGGAGLTGPGAPGTARAITARLLTAAGPMGAELIITGEAITELFPDAAEGIAATPGVRVFPTLRTALTACEAALLARSRRLSDRDLPALRADPDSEPMSALLLIAHAPTRAADAGLAAHTDAVLRLGADRELGAVFFGPWPAATLHVGPDGTLTDPDTPHSVLGRAEQLTAADATDLLAGLLPPLRDSLDVIDPTDLLPAPAAEPTDQPAATVARPAPAPSTADPGPKAGLTVSVLDRVRVIAPDGREVTGIQAQTRSLIALLAVHPDGLTSEQIGEALWPDAPPGKASGRIFPAVSGGRKVLRDALTHEGGAEPGDPLPIVDGRYHLHRELVDTDHRRFIDALAAAAAARRANDDDARRTALRLAADLYHDTVLDDVNYTWAIPVRERVRRQAADALNALAGLLLDASPADTDEALEVFERAIDVDPYNDDLYRRVMRIHAAAGQRELIYQTIRLLEARLLDIDATPEPETSELAHELLAARPRRTRAGSTP